MPAGLVVEPSRLTSAGTRIHLLGQALAMAGRDVARGLDEVDATLPGTSAGPAAVELAAISAGVLRSMLIAIDALAVGLDAAAARYIDVDVLRGRP